MTTTPNFGWTLPAINADADTWGTELNANLSAQDTQVKTISDAATGAATAAAAALVKTNNLSDLASASTARTNLGLGTAATTAASAYDVAGAAAIAQSNAVGLSAQRASNLSDLASASTARTNLGVTATGSDTTYNYRANNLSDVASASTARTNLGIGSMATRALTIQSGGSPSGGSSGDVIFIY